jgi:alpha-tubulin suppressor-like RCC1 family protein
VPTLTVIPLLAQADATVTLNGNPLVPGGTSAETPLAVGTTPLTFVVTAQDGTTTRTYQVSAIRPAETGILDATWNQPYDVPLTSSTFSAAGRTLNLTLNCVPLANELTVIRNPGRNFIQGEFTNLVHGQSVTLDYDGETYHFVANYFGGTGNDLVLVWEGTRVMAWGGNHAGQLGDNSTVNRPLPVNVSGSGVLAGKTVVQVAAGLGHSMALCSDGTIASWGQNQSGELGNNSTQQSNVPVLVNTDAGVSALHGKRVVRIACGSESHSLALCDDGTVAAWGDNSSGQLGDGSTTSQAVPVAVDMGEDSALHGKSVVAISAGRWSSVALCSDGTVVMWGHLGGTDGCTRPIAVDVGMDSALHGKSVVKIDGGGGDSLALCSDGSVAALFNNYLGNDGGVNVYQLTAFPIPASNESSILDKTVIDVATGSGFSIALCSDGTLFSWGSNYFGQLGNGNSLDSLIPVAISAAESSALLGKTVVSLVTGHGFSMVHCSDGSLVSWGANYYGQLGRSEGATGVPSLVNRSNLAPTERFSAIHSGNDTDHNLALVSSAVRPPLPTCSTSEISDLTTTTVHLNGSVNANGFDTTVAFEYGTDGSTFPFSHDVTPFGCNGTTDVSVGKQLTGLAKGTTHYYRLKATNVGGTVYSPTQSFITRTEPTMVTAGVVVLSTTSVQISGLVDAHGSDTDVVFDYGPDQGNLVHSIQADPAVTDGYGETSVSATLTNLQQGTTYYFRVRGTSVAGSGTSGTASFQVATLSGITRVFPSAAPDAEGYVFVTLYPPEAGAGWRFVGEQQWRPSGVPVGGLATGDREIEFKPVAGYIQPPRETISVFSGQAATLVERTYYESAGAGSGGLTVFLKPDDLADPGVPEAQRTQWRLTGDDDTQWRDSGDTLASLPPGDYLIECKPVSGRSAPPSSSVRVTADQTSALTVTYRLADPAVGLAPTVVPFETVSGDSSRPFGFIGQIRSDVGSSSGFLIKPRVVATAGHVVFDDGTLSAVTGLQWLHQRHRGTYEPAPKTPRGYYIFDGYAAQRAAEDTPGSSSPQSQHLDAAAIYFLEDVGRGGASGYLASDLDDNEFLLSTSDKILAGYPVDGVSSSQQGRMHATAPMNAIFTRGYGRTFLSGDIRGMGGMSGGPLCVEHDNGNYYPAAIYLGGSGQTVVRAIDSQVIDLFNRAEVSGNGGDNNTGGGITHTSFSSIGTSSDPGALKVTIQPAAAREAGAGWRLQPETYYRTSGTQKSGLNSGTYTLLLKTVDGFETPASATVTIDRGQLKEITYTYADVNDSPTISAISNQTINEDESTGTIPYGDFHKP